MDRTTLRARARRSRSALLFSLLPALLLCALLAACGAAEPAPAPEPTIAPEPTPSPEPPLPELCISEVMPANRATLPGPDGSFPDWMEIRNLSSSPVSLEGLILTAGRSSWRFPAATLEGGSCALVFCSRGGGDGLWAGFSLSAEGENLTLRAADGRIIDSFSYQDALPDRSMVRGEDGIARPCELPTPGYENGEAGYLAMQASQPLPDLAINEVTVYNRMNGGEDDWVELRNNSAQPLSLDGCFLSDSLEDRRKLPVPHRQLEPGEVMTVSCEGSRLSLSSEGEQLYLFSAEGTLLDCAPLRDIPYGGSFGRMPGENGYFYFASPSKGAENAGGARLISAMPASAEPDGVFDNVEEVELVLSAPGVIHYTLDGSAPSADSPVYREPLRLTETCVVRALSLEEGKLPSRSLDLSYFINEHHTLPVLSLVADPEDLFGRSGIYSHPTLDWERPASAALFDGEESFHIACGAKMHGATSRINQAKKSFKLNFRGVYGGQLHYDLFENGVTDFSSLLLRSSQEGSVSTQMRDILMQQLARQCDPAVVTQDYKFIVLYLNGAYWGVYSIREAHSPQHFALHYGYDPDRVDMYQGKWALKGDFDQVYLYMLSHDLADDAVYDAVTEHIDLDALVTWAIVEAYSGNVDINSPNVRFYYSYEDAKLHYALVDLDLSLFQHGQFTQSLVIGYDFSNIPLYLCANPRFRALMTERLSQYLHGPLSQENAFAMIDSLAAELRPEIPRDAQRWGYSLERWERNLQVFLYDFFSNYGYGGYERDFAKTARATLRISAEDFERYFGDL